MFLSKDRGRKQNLLRKNKANILAYRLHVRLSFIFSLLIILLLATAKETKAAVVVPALAALGLGALKTLGAIAIVAVVIYAIKYLMVLFVWLSAHFLKLFLDPAIYNFTSEKMIIYGWTIVRDICNLFFLLLLLFIAFCTILQIDKYHAKKTLLILILMALLINFSKPIAVFIFDGSQLLMNFFLTKSSGDFTIIITEATKLAEVIAGGTKGGVSEPIIWLVSNLFAIIFLFMYGVALFLLGIYLLIRIVAIWILIIVSPLAFLALAIPDFKKISSDWWSALFRYSYVGPAIAFFLLLSTSLANSLVSGQSKILSSSVAKTPTGNGIPFSTVGEFVKYSVILVFLYASIIISQKFGIAFADAITSRGNKLMTWAGKGIGYRMPKWAAARTGIPGAVRQKIEAVPFAKRWLTKEGWKESLQDREARMAERMGVEGARDKVRLTRMAEIVRKWKDQGITEDPDALRVLSRTGNPLERATAARELAKGKYITNAAEYQALYNNIGQISPRLQTIFAADTRKNMPHLHFRNQVNSGVAVQQAFNTTFHGQSFEDIMKNTPVNTLDPGHANYDVDFDNLVVAHWESLQPNVQQGMLTKMPAPVVNLLRTRGKIP